MKEEKDLFNRFRNKDHSSREQPSERAWNKLEAKLDDHNAENQAPVVPLRPKFQWLKIAAGLAILLGTVAILRPQLKDALNPTQMASNDSESFVIEDLEYSQPSGFYALAIQSSKYYATQPSKLAEGRHEQRLQITNRKTRMPNRTTLAMNESLAKDANTLETVASKKMNSSNGIVSEDYKVASATEKLEIQEVDVDENDLSNTEVENTAIVEANVEFDDASKVTFNDAVTDTESLPSVSTSSAKAVQKSYSKSKKRAVQHYSEVAEENLDASGYEKISAHSNAIAFESLAPSDVNVDYFKWLIGNWEATYDDQSNNIQTWEQKDQFTLSGNAILTINGAEILVERMEIKKIDDQLYFLRVDTQSGEVIKYSLTSLKNDTAVFSNTIIKDEFSIKLNTFNNFSQQNTPSGALQMSQFPGASNATFNFVKTQKD